MPNTHLEVRVVAILAKSVAGAPQTPFMDVFRVGNLDNYDDSDDDSASESGSDLSSIGEVQSTMLRLWDPRVPLARGQLSKVSQISQHFSRFLSSDPASVILSVLGQFVAKIPKIKFFVTGRPEPRIWEGFQLPLLAKAMGVFVLHEVERSQLGSDIRLFFEHNFSELRGHRRGLIRFVDQRNNNPKRQLDRLMQSPESSVLEGKTKFKVNVTLDPLYTSILQDAFGDNDPENDSRIQSILGAVILATNPLSPSTIAALRTSTLKT